MNISSSIGVDFGCVRETDSAMPVACAALDHRSNITSLLRVVRQQGQRARWDGQALDENPFYDAEHADLALDGWLFRLHAWTVGWREEEARQRLTDEWCGAAASPPVNRNHVVDSGSSTRFA